MSRCALITGASRGLGRAIAVTLAKDHGWHIIVNFASNADAAAETVRLIEAEGGTAEPLRFRVENSEEVKNALEEWFAKNSDKTLYALVNNAGITRDQLLVFMDDKDWDAVVDISLKGMYNVTRNVIVHMVRNRKGRIVNVASLSGLKGVPGQTNYAAAKGGMIAATRALAQEIAKRKITVNAVAPGFISSDMTRELDEKELKKLVPMNRFGKPEEVADLVSFLVSAKAGYITGEVVNINGGIY